MSDAPLIRIRGRGAATNPANRFEPIEVDLDPEYRLEEDGREPTRYYRDATRTILATNQSPDVGFDFSVNPYRGCQHGCIYCYARPTHEYFGFSAGLDFERKIFVKEQAPELLRKELSAKKWKPATVAMSGVTDPYQPVERKLELTRGCLRVLADFRNPVGIITKNRTVVRDIDILSELASVSAARVNISVTTLDPKLQQVMEPRTSAPRLRLEAIRALSEAGIPVGVMVAPIIPGLTDHEMPAILEACREAGATSANYVLLRLPFAVKTLFEEWLHTHFPDRAGKVLGRMKQTRGGKLYDAKFGQRMRGEGEYADQIRALFAATCTKLRFNEKREPLSVDSWRGDEIAAQGRPQLDLF